MDREVKASLDAIAGETDPNLRSLLMAALVSDLFREDGFEPVVVGGSAIEFYTEGAYRSGDVDIRFAGEKQPSLEKRSEIMKDKLGAAGSVRSWKVGNQFVDILGELETVSEGGLRSLETPMGQVVMVPVEELIAERVFVARCWTGPNPEAEECTRKLIACALRGDFPVDWREVERIAGLKIYDCLSDVLSIKSELERDLAGK